MTTLMIHLQTHRLQDGSNDAVVAWQGPGVWTSPDGLCRVAVATSPSGVHHGTVAADEAKRLGEAYLQAPDRWPGRRSVPCVVAILDLRRRAFLAGNDDAGIHPLYWQEHGGQLAVSTKPLALPQALGLPARVDPQAVYDYVYFHCIPSPRTVYAGVNKLPAGHQMLWHRNELEVSRRFHVRFTASSRETIDDLAATLLSELEASVGRSMQAGAAEGAFLSGGLDSSTVAGFFSRRKHPQPSPTFSIGFNADGYDEIEYARIAARHFGTEAHEYYVTPDDIHDAVRGIASAFDEPFGNSSAIPVYFCARMARDAGIERMLAGDGGDELFAGNSRYAKQMVFERYGRLPGLLRHGALEPLLLGTPLGRLPLASKAASYVRQANVPLPDRLQSYNYLHRHDPATIFSGSLLERIDRSGPIAQLRSEYDEQPDAHPVDRMMFLDWKYTLHDNDLVKVNTMCGLAGVDVAYPMLDTGLIDLSCRIPASAKLRNNELRWFYKHAVRDFLPEAIIRKKKHGFGLPFGVWLKDHAGLRKLATDSLLSLQERNLFNPSFLPELLRLHAEVHPAYYGEMVWILLMLELWLQSHDAAVS